MPFDPSKPFTVASDDAHQGASGFDPSKPFTVATPPAQMATTAPQSAMAAFQQGQSGAYYQPDIHSQVPLGIGGQEQGRIQANPISPAESFAVGGIKGATALPIVGNVGQKAIEAGTGQNMDQYNQEAANQNPFSYAAGEGLMALKAAPMAIEAGVEGVKAAASAVKDGLQAIASPAVSGTLKVASKVLGATDNPLAAKLSNMLSNHIALSNPEEVKSALALAKQGTSELGESLAKTWKEVNPLVPEEAKFTKPALWQSIQDEVTQQAKESGSELRSDSISKLKREFNRIVSISEDKPIEPTQLWSFAKNAAEDSGKYAASRNFSPAAGSRADTLDQLDQALRSRLYDHAQQAQSLAPDSKIFDKLSSQAESYGKINDAKRFFQSQYNKIVAPATKAQAAQEGLNEASKVLGLGPEKLGDSVYQRLLTAFKYGAPTFQRVYSNLFDKDKQLQEAVKELAQ